MFTGRLRAGLIGLALVLTVSTSAWAQGVTLTAATAGNNVTLEWTPVPGATNYYLEYAQQGGQIFPGLFVGNVTTLHVPGVPYGTYLARVTSVVNNAAGPVSDVTTILVSPGPPAAPSGLSAAINGQDLLLSWGLPAGATALQLRAGTTPGGAEVGMIPLAPSTSLPLGGIPHGKYYVSLTASSQHGTSVPSNELELDLPGCTPPATIPLTMSSFGGFVSIQWPAVPGAAGYMLEVSSTAGGGPDLLVQPVAASETRVTSENIADGNYYVTLKVAIGCGATGTSGQQLLTVTAAGTGPRTPDPAPGQRLPLPGYAAGIVNAMASQYRGDLNNSCHERGGNNRWLFRVVQRLRERDSRWGLNWKRGWVGSMSQDVVTYHFGPGRDEGSTAVYIIDIISNHCPISGGPGPNWNDVTGATRDKQEIGRWTLRPFLAAGFTP